MKTTVALMIALMLGITAMAFSADIPAKAKTIDDLKAAFTGETTASAKYAAYAEKAKEEGFLKVAALFSAASKSEAFHAGNHKAVLEQLGDKAPEVTPKFEVKTTAENLADAIKGETYEVATMYPEFIKRAGESKIALAGISFNYAYQTEQNHKVLYAKALDALKKNAEGTLAGQYMVCPTCGNTYESSSPDRCAICMTSKDRFVTVS